MWSVGVLLFVLLAGELPFGQTQLSQQIMQAEVSFEKPCWRGVSLMAKDLIGRLIVREPSKRLTASEALLHPWIRDVGFFPLGDGKREYSVQGSQLASQLASQGASPLREVLCDEELSLSRSYATDSQAMQAMQAMQSLQGGIVADSQADDDLLWRSRQTPMAERLIVESSVEEEGKGEKRENGGLSTPESKRTAAGEAPSKQGTPYRSGLKAVAVGASILDVVAVKKGKAMESPKRNRGKKCMIQSHDITNYFAKKQEKES